MASYQPTILDAPPQYGLLQGFAQGLSHTSGDAASIYGQAMLKKKLDDQKYKMRADEEKKLMAEKSEGLNQFMAAMQTNPDFEMDRIRVDDNGIPNYSYRRKETPESMFSKDPLKAIKQAMGGIGTESTGRAMGIPEQTPMFPMTPGMPPMSQYNNEGGEYLPYSDVVQQSLVEQYAPGYTPDQAKRGVMGLPIQTPQEKNDIEKQGKQKVFDPALTEKVRGRIKTPEDIDELLKKRDAYEMAQVDVIGILRDYLNSPHPNPSILHRIQEFFK